MLRASQNYIDQSNKTKESMLKALCTDHSILETMDSGMLDFLQSLLKLVDTENKLILKQAETIDAMNKKLDELLSK